MKYRFSRSTLVFSLHWLFIRFTNQRPLSQLNTLRSMANRLGTDQDGNEMHLVENEIFRQKFVYGPEQEERLAEKPVEQPKSSSLKSGIEKPNLLAPIWKGRNDGTKISGHRRLLQGSSDDLIYNQTHKFLCDKCSSNRIGWLYGKCDNMFTFGLMNGALHHDGYVPADIGIGEEYEWISFEYCLDCGQIQSKSGTRFPLPLTYFEKHGRSEGINPDYYEDEK